MVRPIPSGTQTVSDGGGSLTVDGTVALDAPTLAALETVSVTDGGGSLTVDGSVSVGNFPGSQAVTGPLTDTELRATPVPVSGTMTANLGTINGAATAAKQPALGIAGTPSTDVLSVQGVVSGIPQPISDASGSLTVDAPVGTPVFVRLSDGTTAIATLPVSGPLTDAQLRAVAVPVSGTFWQATQPVSGTVTANAGTGPFPISDNAGSLTVDAPVGTPAFVRLSDGASPITALPVTDNAGSLTVDGTVTANPTRPATPTQSSVASSASSVTLLASNANRLGASIYNDSNAILYLKLGATASTTSFTVALAPLTMGIGGFFEVPFGYTGVIDGIWASATGSARITELAA